jgi:hypothetical protein
VAITTVHTTPPRISALRLMAKQSQRLDDELELPANGSLLKDSPNTNVDPPWLNAPRLCKKWGMWELLCWHFPPWICGRALDNTSSALLPGCFGGKCQRWPTISIIHSTISIIHSSPLYL